MMPSPTGMNDLLPTATELFEAAYGALVGDPGFISWGVHQGRNPGRRDTMGMTKEVVYQAALEGNVSFFTGLAERLEADPWTMPTSLRTYIPKDEVNPDKGVRAIDDPCEFKRLIAICVRRVIQERAESYLTTGQYGGRPEWAITRECTLPGATMQDHVATGIWKAIRKGYRHVLVLDLKDAFGLVPQAAAIKVLNRIGLNAEAARWVWRLCRIDAVDARNRYIQYTREGRGIEQGNVLSALIMNLVLAPVIQSLESHLDVRVFAYLDDIYVLAPSHEIATEAFYRFRQSARARGFTNVRRLKRDTDPADSKNSQITNVDEHPVTVLKTYQVDGLGISLHPDKVVKLRQEGKLTGKVTLSKLRKLSDCRSLTKSACRLWNPDAIQPANQKPIIIPSCVITPVDEPERIPPMLSLQELPVKGTGSSVNGNLESHAKGKKELKNPDVHDPDPRIPDERDYNARVVKSSYRERIMSSRRHGADGIPYYRDSRRPQGVTTPDRMRNDAGDLRAFLSIRSPDILPNIFCPGRLAFGNKYKTSILDLTKLAPVIGNDVAVGSIVQCVNRLIRMVRLDNQAEVIIDPTEAWTAIPTVLGNANDSVYTRKSFKFQSDGTVIIVLVARTQKREPGRSDAVPQEADVVVRSIRAVDRVNYHYKITLAVHGTVCTGFYDASSPNDTVGALEALAYVLKRFPDSLVAVAVDVVQLLQDSDHIEPSNVGIRRALKPVLRQWSWSRVGEAWLVGRRT